VIDVLGELEELGVILDGERPFADVCLSTGMT
jgi:hypothetical protein